MIRKKISHDFNENISENLHESSMLCGMLSVVSLALLLILLVLG